MNIVNKNTIFKSLKFCNITMQNANTLLSFIRFVIPAKAEISKTIIGTTFFAIVFCSCQKEVEVKLPESKYKLVLNSVLSTDSFVTVNVSRSKKLYIDDNKNVTISNAIVSVYENGNLLENLPYTSDGVYKSTITKPKIGNEYKIVVKADGYDNAEASETLIQQAIITNIVLEDSALFKEEQMYAKLSFEISDVAGVNNYYEVSALSGFYQKNYNPQTGQPTDSTYTQFLSYLTVTDEALKENAQGGDIDGNTDYSDNAILFSDKYFDGKTYKVNVYLSQYQFQKDTLTIKVKSMTKAYYEYRRTALLQSTNQGDPFSEPVRVYTNVTGGLGILGSFTEVKKFIVK